MSDARLVICTRCRKSKPPGAFAFHRSTKRHPRGLQSECRVCQSERRREELARDPMRNIRQQVRQRYGLSLDDLAAMKAAQGGVCAICGGPGRLYVDHDHDSGRIRGLLCNRCNLAIGQFGDEPELLRQAARYVEERKEVVSEQTGT
jgi:hypothetical protein